MNALDTFEVNGFTVEIWNDPDVDNPHDDASPACQLAMSHKHYNWPNDAGIDFSTFEGWDEVAEELRANHDALVIDVVYAYDHSGIAFKTGERTYPFDDAWDSGIAGLAYVTRATWQDCMGTEWTGSDEQMTRAHELIASEVKVYGEWANGECYGYSITDEYDDTVNSCGGFVGWDFVTDAAKEAASSLEHEIKCTGTLNKSTGEIDHAGPCQLHGIDDDN